MADLNCPLGRTTRSWVVRSTGIHHRMYKRVATTTEEAVDMREPPRSDIATDLVEYLVLVLRISTPSRPLPKS
jgi:hypothetical protein